MPTYEYECQACKHFFSSFQSMKDEPLKKCPACKKMKLKRLLGTGAGMIFKGSGFYSTDYRSESYKSAASKSESAPSSSSPSSSSASESKSSDSKPKAEATPKKKGKKDAA